MSDCKRKDGVWQVGFKAKSGSKAIAVSEPQRDKKTATALAQSKARVQSHVADGLGLIDPDGIFIPICELSP